MHGHSLLEIDAAMQQSRSQAQTTVKRLESTLADLRSNLQTLTNQVDEIIRDSRSDAITRSQRLYQNQFQDYSPASVLSRTVPCDMIQHQCLTKKITAKSVMLEIGMIIRPLGESWITDMFGMDMIYLFDNDAALLEPAVDTVSEHLRGKLRAYAGGDQDPFAALPRSQISQIFAWNFFNYKPLPVIFHYLWEFTSLLRAGGSVLLTFNDCDRAVNAQFAESNFMCFTPASMILPRCQQLGYDVMEHHTADNGLSWLELRWPGRWDNLRGAPVITKIHARSK